MTPLADKAINHAKRNLSFLKSFYSEFKYNDWAITVAFYTAIHFAEYAISKKKKIKLFGADITVQSSSDARKFVKDGTVSLPKNLPLEKLSHHAIRNQIVQENFIKNDIGYYYYELYNNSRTARYREFSWNNNSVKLIVQPAINAIISWVNDEFKAKIEFSF